MASTINGTSTGTGGLISTGDDSGILNIQTNETNAVTIDASQMVGIGTTTPKVRLAGKVLSINGTDSGASYQASIELLVNGASAGEMWANSNDFVIGSYSTQPMIFRTQNTERMRIDSSGNVLVKKTASSSSADNNVGAQLAATGKCIFEASGDRALILNRLSDNGIIQEFFRGAGNQVGNIQANTSSVAYNTSSDYRLKKDISPMTGALAKVTQLKPVTYKWRSDGEEGQGFIAHELQAIVPDCVTGAKDAVDADGKPVYQGIDTSFLVATLTAAIQELKAINDTQAETLTQQTEAINALTARIVALESRGTV